MGCVSGKSAESAWESTIDYGQRELLAKILKNSTTAMLNPDDYVIGDLIQIGGM